MTQYIFFPKICDTYKVLILVIQEIVLLRGDIISIRKNNVMYLYSYTFKLLLELSQHPLGKFYLPLCES